MGTIRRTASQRSKRRGKVSVQLRWTGQYDFKCTADQRDQFVNGCSPFIPIQDIELHVSFISEEDTLISVII